MLLSAFIEPKEITRYRVAKAVGVQQRRIDEIFAGERSITADTAIRLSIGFGKAQPHTAMRKTLDSFAQIDLGSHDLPSMTRRISVCCARAG